MAFTFGTALGSSFVASVVSEEVYDPVYDTEVDGNFIYELLPSFYRNLMEDKEIPRKLWEGLIQDSAAELLNLWQIDYSKSLRDVPVISQRKWIRYDFVKELDFVSDPSLTLVGALNSFEYNATAHSLASVWTSRGGQDRATVALLSDADEGSSLSWSIVVNLSRVEFKGSALFGYFNSANTQLANALVCGVIGDTSGSETLDVPRALLAHYDAVGNATVSVGALVLNMDTNYRFVTTYTARTGALVLTVTELFAVEISSATGETGTGVGGEVYTSTLTDSSINFDTAGITTADTLVVGTENFRIISVDGFTLTVSPTGLPVDVENLPYEIRGDIERLSLSIDLPGDASDPTFVIDAFGTANMDTRKIPPVLFVPPGAANRQRIVGTTTTWEYLDPTTTEIILSVPQLQNHPEEETFTVYEGTDYTVVSTLESGSKFKFQEPPPEILWAEYAGYDEGTLRNNFGANVGLVEKASDAYKSKIRGLYYAYFQGPTLDAIRIGVHLLIGLPIAERAGVVESINLSYSGVLGQIRVAGVDYLFPLDVGTSLVVGESVSQFQPLCDGVEVIDYITDPLWWESILSFNEIQKYHTFSVRLNLDAFALATLVFAANFVKIIKPTWKRVFYIVFKNLEDSIDIEDSLALTVTLHLYDVPCTHVIVVYDDNIYEGEEADWRYSQGVSNWDSTSAAMRATATEIPGFALVTAGSATVTGTGTTFTADVGGPGAVTDKYVAIARRVDGVAGETIAGSNIFTDATVGAFASAEAGGRIEITGEGTVEIQSVDSDNQLTLDAPMAATNVGVSWVAVGKLVTWSNVASVTNDTELLFDNINFPGPTGNYILAVLDNAYKDVFYDQFLEGCPDELLSFEATLSAGYGETILTGRLTFTATSPSVSGTGTQFLSEIGGPGVVTDKYLVTPEGVWHEVIQVVSDSSLVLASPAPNSFSEITSFLASDVLGGTCTVTLGSANVPTTVSQVGVLNPGDWIQVVPTQNTAVPIAGNPVVRVQSVAAGAITLDANYVGVTATPVKMILRGTSAVLPLSLDLPDSQTTVVTQDFTGWFGTPISVLSSTVVEPTP